jgi:hypothetical protein
MKEKIEAIPPRTGKAQIVRCHCGNVFAACTEPECYTDIDWQRDVRKYIKGGCTVETVTSEEVKEAFASGSCKCDKTGKKKKEPIAIAIIENQQKLF